MSKWSDVIEAQRRWADRIARADVRFQERSPARRPAFPTACLRALSILGRALVSLGHRLQAYYPPRPGTDDGRLRMEQ